ncbi:hypothetical protein WOLCODRAFT_136498 [Wolfiporia cocos MD-104 SS10]|uniref:RING-type domain-containing protein n=1 Tax=Wolfiporia cocos (strain MD-104) TaxID=742152 RepID=A0A2H3JD44_WOLCO|nr:hypothetical protein WOLCODRAFT_136498 [Wolfiporia cocos MD-104 SS10]
MPALQTVSDSSDEEQEGDDSASEDSEEERERENIAETESVRPGLRNVVDEAWAILRASFHNQLMESEARELEENGEEDEFDLDWETFGPPRRFPSRTVSPADLFDMLFSNPSRQMIDNDPERAQILLSGLEPVSNDQIRRYEKLRKGHEDDSDGCAICRDSFLDDEECPEASEEPTDTVLVYALFKELPFHLPSPSILAFPCAGRHLFHNNCLSPWLARKTTCPACRFDIDPDSLTLRTIGEDDAQLISGRRTQSRRRKWTPPKVCSFEEWLDEEERVRELGIERTVVQPSTVTLGIDDAHADDELEGIEDDDAWSGTDEEDVDSSEASSASITGRNMPDWQRSGLLHGATTAASLFASLPRQSHRQHQRHIADLIASIRANNPAAAMDVHDSARESVLLHALRMGRSTFHVPRDAAVSRPSRAYHHSYIPESDQEDGQEPLD